MSAVLNQKHIHELERSRANKEIYRCVHPTCNFYQNRSYLEGKQVLCGRCKNPFILNWVQLRNKKPVCEFCTKSPKSQVLREMRDRAFKTLNELPEEFKQKILDETLE